MKMMRALVVDGKGGYDVKEVPVPVPNEHQALVRTLANSMCGTDERILEGNLKACCDGYPTVIGHEGVGEVIEIGSKVRNYKVGDHVLTCNIMGRVGDYYSTWGAMAEYTLVSDAEAMEEDGVDIQGLYDNAPYMQKVIPSDLDPVYASMIVTFREVYMATGRMNWKAGEGIVIYGLGPVGLTFVRFAKLLGLSPIVAVDLVDKKLENAKALGADYAFNSTKCDLPAEVRKIFPEGPDILLDAAGVPALINQNLNLVKNMGRIYVYGVTAKNDLHIDWTNAPYNFSISFIQWPTNKGIGEVHDDVMKYVLSGELKGEDYISDIFDFDHVIDAVDLFVSKKFEKKISVRF